MRMRMIALAAWLACAGVSFGEPIDKKKLRKLIELPYTSGNFGFPFFSGDFPEPPTKEAFDRTLREMKGDASDAPRYEHLGDLYYMKREKARSDEAYEKAVKLYREQIENRPKDDALRSRFAELLINLDRYKEAELVLQEALQLVPHSAESLMVQVFLLSEKCRVLLFGHDSTGLSSEEQVKRMQAYPPCSQQVAQIHRLLRESRRLMDQAIALEPDNIGIREKRVKWLVAHAYYESCLKLLGGEKIDLEEERVKFLASPAWLQSLYELFRRKVLRTPSEVHTLVMLEVYRARKELSRDGKQTIKIFEQLTASSQQTIRKELKKLEGWIKGTDKKMAADAAEVLGELQFILFENWRAAAASLNHAIILDPSRQQAREMLLFVLEEDRRIDEAVKVLEAALQAEDTTRNRFLLARLLQSRNREEARKQLLLGLRVDPWDFWCNLGLAALLMKAGDADSLDLARSHLRRIKVELDQRGTREQLAEYNLLLGIQEGLCDHIDDARALLEKAEQQGADKRARKALAVLAQSSSGKH